jgi:diketogulonate reductase-like aldo/keto reductase
MQLSRHHSGVTIPRFGQGTWGMGERRAQRGAEIAALRHGIERGIALIDTAEMYGDGGAEDIVGEAIAGHRDDLFIVSKVLPDNASRRGTIAACEQSLRRMRIDRIDLYLLHWRGDIPLAQTLAAFAELRAAGKIRAWGVSNLDLSDMQELAALDGGVDCATNQLLYNLTRRGIEYDLLPWCRARRMPVMAYSPVEQGRMLNHPALRALARKLDATPAQVALSWLLRQDDIVVIPKAVTPAHIDDNLGALDLDLNDGDLAALDRAFPPPAQATPLEML